MKLSNRKRVLMLVSPFFRFCWGLPIVATPIAGVPVLLEDGKNGFLIQPGDYLALAERIIQLTEDPKLCHAMAKANIAKIREAYHPYVFEMKIKTLYRDLLQTG